MNRLFQVTVYTGQQLVLEGLQRWLHRPCESDDAQRQRRSGIKNLIVLLLKTAATGVLATILDAAIEYRRRQLLAAAEDGASDSAGGSSSRFSGLGLGPLSRTGIAAWKTRLLLAIDEMERHAEQYGIEPRGRFAPSAAAVAKEEQLPAFDAAAEKADGDEETETSLAEGAENAVRQAALAATVSQLQQLARDGGDDAAATLDETVDALVESLLGGEVPPPSVIRSASFVRLSLAASPSCSDVAALDSPVLSPPSSGTASPSSAASDCCEAGVCHICMDRQVGVQVLGCHHDLCFQCARRLCATQDHALPQCPFCRQPIDGFVAYSAPSKGGAAAAAALPASTVSS